MFHGLRPAADPYAPEDRDLITVVLDETRSLCPVCGTYEWEWEPKYGGDRTAYVSDMHRCEGCKQNGMTAERVRDSGTLNPHGLYPRLYRLDREEEQELTAAWSRT